MDTGQVTAPPASASAAAGRIGGDVAAVVLVEGVSDQRVVEALARRHGRDLAAERVAVVPMGGATNIAHFLDVFGPAGRRVRLAGLCDAGQDRAFRRALERAGFGSVSNRRDMERLGFFVCEADLEDELIRALGVAAVEDVIAAQGELASLRILQNQPAQRERDPHRQLHRFLGTRAGRKIRYGELLVAALDATNVPAPLARLLAAI
jgi:hypothetical protein